MSLVDKHVYRAAADFGRALFRVYVSSKPERRNLEDFLKFAASGWRMVEMYMAAFPDATEEDFVKHMEGVNSVAEAIR